VSSDLTPEIVEPLMSGRLGRPYRFVAECASTQRLLGEDEPEGTTVATDHQTEGRGRLGRVWEDAPGRGLLFSVLLRPTHDMSVWPELSIVAGEAVAVALPVDARVSHPNDVFVGDRKVAGILPEASKGWVRLGIGINVNQTADELPAKTVKPTTSLRIATGQEWARGPLLAAILLELEARYDAWQARQAGAGATRSGSRATTAFCSRNVRAASIAAPRLRPLSFACLMSITVSSASTS
jgi:BirA family transcriptional regulator, biotin operon repressor / biotin---[acetyl-CoA-carboxylase] ligase